MTVAPQLGSDRIVFLNDMNPGDTSGIPSSVAMLRVQYDTQMSPVVGDHVILVVALWDKNEFSDNTVLEGYKAFIKSVPDRINDKLARLVDKTLTEEERELVIKEIKDNVRADVKEAIAGIS